MRGRRGKVRQNKKKEKGKHRKRSTLKGEKKIIGDAEKQKKKDQQVK